MKNSEVCRLILSPCFADGCIAPLLKKQAYGAGESGEVKIQEPEFADSLARPAGAAKFGSGLRKKKASSPVITCVSSYLNHSAVTPKVKMDGDDKVNIHAAVERFTSGQLLFLG